MALGGIALAAQAALGIGQAIFGAKKRREAPDLPTYEIPSELEANLSQSERMALEGLPEAQKREYIESIQRSGATALSGASTRKGGLGLVSSIADQERDAYRNMLSMDSQARMENQNKVLAMRDRIAEEKWKKHQADTMRAETLRTEANQLIGAGIQNVGGSLGSMASLSSMFGGGSLFGSGDSARSEARGVRRENRRALRESTLVG
jgi:hypothetical protein